MQVESGFFPVTPTLFAVVIQLLMTMHRHVAVAEVEGRIIMVNLATPAKDYLGTFHDILRLAVQ